MCLLPAPQALAEGTSGVGGAKGSPSLTRPANAATGDVEEILVLGEKTKGPNPVVMSRIRSAGGRGGNLYRQGNYAEAFPLLLAAAERGFKLAQARVGYIYQQGLGGVPRNAQAAIGWLGVAATPTTSPEIKNYFNDFVERIPDTKMALIDKIVDAYTARYGNEATGVHCENKRMAGTHISRLKCYQEDEDSYNDVIDDANAPGQLVIEIPPPGTGAL